MASLQHGNVEDTSPAKDAQHQHETTLISGTVGASRLCERSAAQGCA